MDPSSWSPYNQQPFTHGNGGSPQSLILPPTPSDDTLNSYGSANPHPLLLSPCPGMQPRPNTADPTLHPSTLLNSHYEPTLLTPPVRSSKETPDYFNETLYNGICKENNAGMHDFGHNTGMPSRNDTMGCLVSENSNFNHQVPPVSFHSSDLDKLSTGLFGVLPHEAVMTRPSRYDRNKDKFISPASKPVSSLYNNNMPYPEQDVNSVYTSTPLSTHSVFSNDNTSRSPIVNSVTSPNMSNFSSPSDYYSSPKNNFGAYNNLQSPVPQSPSVAQHSYPNSPFTNLDPVSHISSAPPCSPMSSGSYVNKLNDRGVMGSQVPQRNGQKTQHSPSNMVGGNSVVCYPQQSQGMVHHGHQPSVSKTSDYHSDYNVFPHNHVSPSSYPSVYPAIHSSQMACDDPSMVARQHASHPNMPHDNRMQYPHSSPLPSNMESSSFLQGKGNSVRHDTMYNACSALPQSQSMHPPAYQDCSSVIDPMRGHSLHPPPPLPPPPHHSHQQHHANSMMPPMMSNDRQYGYQHSDLHDEKNALDMFNSHVDSGVHNPDHCQSSIAAFLDGDLPMLDADMLTNRDMRLPVSNPQPYPPPPPPPMNSMSMENTNRGLLNHQMPSNCHNIPNTDMSLKNNMNYPYCPTGDVYRGPGNMTFNSLPRRRGRRGRRRKADIAASNTYCQYQSYKADRNPIYNNGYQLNHVKLPEYRSESTYNNTEYRTNDCFSNCPKSYKERLDAYEFHSTYYAPSKYQSLRKKDESHSQNNVETSYKIPKRYLNVVDDLRFLGELKFPDDDSKETPRTMMKTRNRDSEGFLQCYRNFLELRIRKSDDDDVEVITSPKEHRTEKEHKEKKPPKHVPKLTIKLGRCNNPGEWRLKETHLSPQRLSDNDDESASIECAANSSSHKKENTYSEGKHREKSKSTAHSADTEKPPPKKRGRKAKHPKPEPVVQPPPASATVEDPIQKLLLRPIKQEVLSDVEDAPVVICNRRATLRSQRPDTIPKEEPKPGPSIKIEPPDMSSDDIDIIDDSDSDPVWTPTARGTRSATKAFDTAKCSTSNTGVKKPRRKYTRRNSSSGSGAGCGRRKRGSHNSSPKRTGKDMAKLATSAKKRKLDPEIKVKQEKKCDVFLIAKADLAKVKPPLWRIDTDMNMLQRFDQHEQQGHLVHRNTYTYAAWNKVTEAHYLRVKVNVLSFSKMMYVVEYQGIDEQSGKSADPSRPNAVNPLRESFEVFLQTLISQALDPNFLSEIASENDQYFLTNISEIERITQEKKNLLLKDTWDKELKKCSEVYPCINILPRNDSGKSLCQICSVAKSEKLVQFYGPPYDSSTLGSTGTPLSNKTQFHVCAICSSTMSLYSRLHHQKYNFFVKCRTKMNQVKNDKGLESHALLDYCLQDATWINMSEHYSSDETLRFLAELCVKRCIQNNDSMQVMTKLYIPILKLFHEMEEVWKECEKLS